MRPITADGLPILDRAGPFENAYIATGYAMQGVTLAPTSGRALAELIATGERPAILEPFRLDRFGRVRLPIAARVAQARGSRVTKLRVAIIGSGNIGTDLMMKIARSPSLELVGMAGIDPESDGLRKARERGITVSARRARRPARAGRRRSTSPSTRPRPARTPSTRGCWPTRGIRSVDLTPAALGPAVVPPVNLYEHRGAGEVNLITCGAQATIPIVAAVSAVADVAYAETVSTVSSRSAGPGTRQNIDEFTTSTARGLETVGGARKAKAIIILNPADPPVMMRNTIYLEVADPDREAIEGAIAAAVARRRRVRARVSPDRRPADRRRRRHGDARGRGRGRQPSRLRRQPRHHDLRRRARRRAVRRGRARDHVAGASGSSTRRCATARTRSRTSYRVDQVETVARALDRAGVWAIAVGHGDGLGASSIQYGRPLHSDAELLAAAAGVVGRERRSRSRSSPASAPRPISRAHTPPARPSRASRPSAPRPTSACSISAWRASSA